MIFSSRIVSSPSTTSRAKRLTLFTSTRSIFFCRQSLSIRWNSARFAALFPLAKSMYTSATRWWRTRFLSLPAAEALGSRPDAEYESSSGAALSPESLRKELHPEAHGRADGRGGGTSALIAPEHYGNRRKNGLFVRRTLLDGVSPLLPLFAVRVSAAGDGVIQ